MKKTYRNGQSCRKTELSAGNKAVSHCPPELNKSVKRALLDEIKVFNKKLAREEADKSSKGNASIDAYYNWLDQNGGHEPIEANPDVLSENSGINYLPSKKDGDTANLLKEVRQAFSPRELQAWNLVMRHSLSYREAADLLSISTSSVQNYVKRAESKFRKFMEASRNG